METNDLVILDSPIHPLTRSLFDIEERVIENAVSKRKDEFRTGRRLARQAFERLGFAPCALPCGLNREPIWPEHLVGSISHSASHCVVAVGLRTSYQSIGIDIEPDKKLPSDVVDLVLTEEELRQYRVRHKTLNFETLSFSAKESVFKCLFPLIGFYFDFKEVSLRFDESSNSFTAYLAPRVFQASRLERLNGTYQQVNGHLLTLAYLETPD